MTIGVLTTSFPRFAGDFAGGFVEDDVRAHVARGETVDVIAAGPWSSDELDRDVVHLLDDDDRTPGRGPDLGPAVRIQRVQVPRIAGRSPLFFGDGAPEVLETGGLASWLQACAFWAGLCDAVRARAHSWNRIVAHWLVPSALAARAVAPRLPLTAHAHSGDVALLERLPGGSALARYLAREIDDLNFVSADLKNRFTRLTGFATGRVVVANAAWVGGARTADLARGRREQDRSQMRSVARTVFGMQRRTVLSVGRLVPIKGFDILLRAVADAAARQHLPAWEFATVVILGDGPERLRLQSLAQRMNLDLRMPGFVPRADVARWMSAADVYVQPSRQLPTGRTEGLPTATVEALRAGLPVIASRTGGLSELEEYGVRLVARESVTALSGALRGQA